MGGRCPHARVGGVSFWRAGCSSPAPVARTCTRAHGPPPECTPGYQPPPLSPRKHHQPPPLHTHRCAHEATAIRTPPQGRTCKDVVADRWAGITLHALQLATRVYSTCPFPLGVRSPLHTHSVTHTHTHMHSHMHTHPHTCTRPHKHISTLTYMHTRPHAHIRTLTHMHLHMHGVGLPVEYPRASTPPGSQALVVLALQLGAAGAEGVRFVAVRHGERLALVVQAQRHAHARHHAAGQGARWAARGRPGRGKRAAGPATHTQDGWVGAPPRPSMRQPKCIGCNDRAGSRHNWAKDAGGETTARAARPPPPPTGPTPPPAPHAASRALPLHATQAAERHKKWQYALQVPHEGAEAAASPAQTGAKKKGGWGSGTLTLTPRSPDSRTRCDAAAVAAGPYPPLSLRALCARAGCWGPQQTQ